METAQNEKSLRLQSLLKDALQPILDKMDTLEQEVIALRKEQKMLQKQLEESQK